MSRGNFSVTIGVQSQFQFSSHRYRSAYIAISKRSCRAFDSLRQNFRALRSHRTFILGEFESIPTSRQTNDLTACSLTSALIKLYACSHHRTNANITLYTCRKRHDCVLHSCISHSNVIAGSSELQIF